MFEIIFVIAFVQHDALIRSLGSDDFATREFKVFGVVVDYDGTVLTRGVCVEAWCEKTGILLRTEMSDERGRFALAIDAKKCGPTFRVVFQRLGSSITTTRANILSRRNNDLGNVIVPTNQGKTDKKAS